LSIKNDLQSRLTEIAEHKKTNIKKTNIMAKSQDAKKTVKKEPLKTPKEKKEEKREKKLKKG